MYIASFHIDGFGIFSNIDVAGLPPGMAIFYGRNEAGKSTCLEFLRVMLTGFPEGRKNSARYKAQPGAMQGGSLVLREIEDMPGDLTLIRRPGKGNLVLLDEDGHNIPQDVLVRIFAGINQEVYRKVFGFSLGELEAFESLNAEEVRSALYGASFGAGVASPAEALKQIRQKKQDIFRPRGTRPLNASFERQETLATQIGEWRDRGATYDSLCGDLAELDRRLEELRSHKAEMESERRKLESRLGVWLQWERWMVLNERLAQMEPARDGFPEEATARLERLQAAREACEGTVKVCAQKVAALKTARDAQKYDAALLRELPLLQRLAEQKSSYRHALGQTGMLDANLKRLDDDLATALSLLGPGWNCDRILATDRSLFSRESLEERAAELNSASAARQAAVSALNKSNADVKNCEASLADLNGQLERLPKIVAVLNEAERADLRRDMARLEECRRLAPGREKNLKDAEAVLERALVQAQIHLPHAEDFADSSQLVRDILERVLARQEEASLLARETLKLKEEAALAFDALGRAEEEADARKKRLDDAENSRRAQAGPGRDALEAKWKTLKKLRTIATDISKEKDRLQELDSRINLEKAAKGGMNWSLFLLSALLFAASAAIFCAHWLFHLTELDLGNDLFIPLNTWAGYVTLVCGVAILGAGWPGSGYKRRKLELAQLESRRETSAMHLAELGNQAQQACQLADIDSMDDITLEAREMLLEREREQCFNEERSRRDVDALKMEYESKKEQLASLEQAAQDKDSAVQKARRRWHSLMQDLDIGFVPSPEGCEAFFARAGAAHLAYDNVANAQKEIESLWDDLHMLEESITGNAAIRERLENSPQPLGIEDAVRLVLESCGEAEENRARQIRCQEAIADMEQTLARARDLQTLEAHNLDEINSRWEEAQSAWAQCVGGFGLGENLKPETVRQAFACMENCLALEEKRRATQQDLEQARLEVRALADPISQMLARLDREPGPAPDWLAVLDELAREAQKGAEIAANRERLIAALMEQENELAAEEASLKMAAAREAALLKQGGAANEEEFRRLAREQAERTRLESERDTLASALSLAASGEPLEEFAASFKAASQAQQEGSLDDLRRQLEAVQNDEFEIVQKIGELKAKCDSLASADALAGLNQEEAMQRETTAKLADTWSVCALAEAIIADAKAIFERDRQPEVIKSASGIFDKITNGKWRGITAALEDASLAILPRHGEPVAPELLSRGAQEQAYLALRLAYIQEHSRRASTLPVIMDEILVNFDPDRVERTARALADLTAASGTKSQQIIYFTCQPHMVEALKSATPQAPVYLVENHTIRRRDA